MTPSIRHEDHVPLRQSIGRAGRPARIATHARVSAGELGASAIRPNATVADAHRT